MWAAIGGLLMTILVCFWLTPPGDDVERSEVKSYLDQVAKERHWERHTVVSESTESRYPSWLAEFLGRRGFKGQMETITEYRWMMNGAVLQVELVQRNLRVVSIMVHCDTGLDSEAELVQIGRASCRERV